jgi:hypothetical protein
MKSKKLVVKEVLADKLKNLNKFNKTDYCIDEIFYQNFVYNHLRPYFLAAKLVHFIQKVQNRAKICDKNRQNLTSYSNSNHRILVEQEDISKYFQFFVFLLNLNQQIELNFEFKQDHDNFFTSQQFSNIEIYKVDLAPAKKIRFLEVLKYTQQVDETFLSQRFSPHSNEQNVEIYEQTQQFGFFNNDDHVYDSDYFSDNSLDLFCQTQPFSIYFNTQPFNQPFFSITDDFTVASSQIPSYQGFSNVNKLNDEFEVEVESPMLENFDDTDSNEVTICNQNIHIETAPMTINVTTVKESINKIDYISQSVETQSKRGNKRKTITVGLSKRQRLTQPLHSKILKN